MTNTAASKAYDIRSCQTKTLAVRILQGYEITKTKCTHCGVPLMEYKGNVSCVICPKLVDTIEEYEEDGGVEIINNLLSGSMLGSMSSSLHGQSGRNQSLEELDDVDYNSIADVMKSSYSIESEVEQLPSDEEQPLATSPAESVAKTERDTETEREEMPAPPAKEAKKDHINKNVLFMKMIEEMAQTKKKEKKQLALSTTYVSVSQEPPALKSPSNDRKKASQAAPLLACESPKVATKRMSINNIVGDESAKSCYMPAWESKMNSGTERDLEGKIKTMACADKDVESSDTVVKTSDDSRDDQDDIFFREIREKAANKQKVDPFSIRTNDNATGDLQPTLARPESFESEEDVGEKEFRLQQQRYRSAKMRKMEEKMLMESMTNHGKSTQPISAAPLDEMKALTVKCMNEERVPEPFDESKAQSPVITDDKEAEKEPEAYTAKLLTSTNKVLGETKLHLSKKKPIKEESPKKKKQSQAEIEKVSNSSDSIAESMKQHSTRIVALEAKTLRKYTNAALAKTNPNPSSASLRSLSTTEKDKRQTLRSRVVELEAEALRKHSEAALAALHARQALDRMTQNRKKNISDKSTGEKKQSKIEDLSISSSLSTKDETASHPSHSVESASLSQYSEYEYRHTNDDVSREEGSILTPTRERRSRSTVRDINPPELNISRTHSSQYHREEREYSRSRSVPRSRMPPNIMLPSLQSASPRHHASSRSRDGTSRPHLMPYSPRTTTPRKSSQPPQRPFSHRAYSPSPDLYRNGSSNIAPYKYHGSMTPRTFHEQQHFDFHRNQAASRNYESMMLASNQTVQERMMDQQQPRMVYSDNHFQPAMMMNGQYQERMINPQMVQQQRSRVGFPPAHFDPAMQHSHLNSPKVRFTHPHQTQFDGAVNVQYANPIEYVQDARNDYPSMRYDVPSTRW